MIQRSKLVLLLPRKEKWSFKYLSEAELLWKQKKDLVVELHLSEAETKIVTEEEFC